MTIIDSIAALAIEPGDYIEINDNYILVENVEDNGDIVLVFGYSTLTGDNAVEETSAYRYHNLITDEDD